ncbi:allophanate hydrolase 2 subunit 1 [Vibrio sp. JCM 19236]|nr:allophanate hydrolase 2 subunit 1 [Vibrio sp. JCM 19236]
MLIRFSDVIDPSLPPLINQAREHLLQHYKAQLVQAVPSYTTLLLEFTPVSFNANNTITEISQILTLAGTVTTSSSEARVIEIPTYYGPETCLDIALYLSLSIQEIASLHSSELYQVYALGFAPGFAFMLKCQKRCNFLAKTHQERRYRKAVLRSQVNKRRFIQRPHPEDGTLLAEPR